MSSRLTLEQAIGPWYPGTQITCALPQSILISEPALPQCTSGAAFRQTRWRRRLAALPTCRLQGAECNVQDNFASLPSPAGRDLEHPDRLLPIAASVCISDAPTATPCRSGRYQRRKGYDCNSGDTTIEFESNISEHERNPKWQQHPREIST